MSGDVEVRWKEAPGGKKLKPEKGDVLMCQTRALSDCVLRVPSEIAVCVEKPPAPRRGVIRDIRKLTGDVAHFELHLSEPMDFEAGQFVVLETGDLTGGRAYSMVNFDQSASRLALVLKRKPGGRFSDWLFARDNGEARCRRIRPAWPRRIPSGRGQKHRLHRRRIGHCRHDVDPRTRRPRRSLPRPQGHVSFSACGPWPIHFIWRRSRAMSRPRTATLRSRSRCPMKLSMRPSHASLSVFEAGQRHGARRRRARHGRSILTTRSRISPGRR